MVVDIKKIGLELAEQNLKVLIAQVVKPLAVEYIQNSPTKIDDAVLPFVDMLEKALLEMAEKISE
jgi:hypothetical protein